MRTVAALAVAAVLLTGCTASGGTGADDPQPTPAPPSSGEPQASKPTSVGEPLTKEQVDSAVPSLAGWGPSEPLGAGDLTNSTVTPAACQAFVDGISAIDPTYTATESLSQGAFGPFLELTVSTYHDQAPGSESLAGFDESLANCPEMTVDGPQGVLTFAVSPLSFPNLGDETVSLRLQGRVSFFPITVDVATVIVGSNTYSVTQVATGGSTSRDDMVSALEATMANVAAA